MTAIFIFVSDREGKYSDYHRKMEIITLQICVLFVYAIDYLFFLHLLIYLLYKIIKGGDFNGGQDTARR